MAGPQCPEAVVEVVCGGALVTAWVLRARTDLALVEHLARLQLAARRCGCVVRVRRPPAELIALLDLVGLRELIG